MVHFSSSAFWAFFVFLFKDACLSVGSVSDICWKGLNPAAYTASQHPWRTMLMLFRHTQSGGAAHCMSNHVCLCEMKICKYNCFCGSRWTMEVKAWKELPSPFAFGETIFSFHFQSLTWSKCLIFLQKQTWFFFFFLDRMINNMTSEPRMIQMEVWSAILFWLCSF